MTADGASQLPGCVLQLIISPRRRFVEQAMLARPRGQRSDGRVPHRGVLTSNIGMRPQAPRPKDPDSGAGNRRLGQPPSMLAKRLECVPLVGAFPALGKAPTSGTHSKRFASIDGGWPSRRFPAPESGSLGRGAWGRIPIFEVRTPRWGTRPSDLWPLGRANIACSTNRRRGEMMSCSTQPGNWLAPSAVIYKAETRRSWKTMADEARSRWTKRVLGLMALAAGAGGGVWYLTHPDRSALQF